MKSEGSYLLIAKILVVARLLHKALGQSKNKPPIVDQLWEKLLSMRRKLLRRIDKRLANTTGETASLVESMCAYALVTSSAPSDVLQHFHKVRMDKIASELKRGDDELAKHGISALKLCIQTCLDTQTIFPRRLAEGLTKLKAHPLIQDVDVRGLYELNLDVHDRWMGDEARNYTPWPRHDELQRPEAEKMLHGWSKEAISTFLKGIKKALQGEDRLQEVAHLRQELIETWILSGSRMAGIKSTNVLDDLRDTMNEKLESIVRGRTAELQGVVTELRSQLNSRVDSRELSSSLWSTTTNSADLSNGAQNFKATILNAYQGRDQFVVALTSAFDKWMDSVLEVKGIVKSMKEARWDDTFADDVDDEADDEIGDSKQTLLSDDDPRLLEEVTQEALGETLQSLGASFSKIVDQVSRDEAGKAVQKAVFILRVVREISDRIPRLKLQEKSTPMDSPFASDTLQALYETLAAHVASPTVQAYKTSLAYSSKTRTNSHILWDGSPPLPSQPSPSAFRFMRELNKSMASLGSDLWAPACIAVLKPRVAKDVEGVWQDHVGAINAIAATKDEDAAEEAEDQEGTTNGATSAEKNGQSSSDLQELKDRRLKQLLFDALYISRFVATPDVANGLADLAKKADVAQLDEAALNRLKKNAADYAKKTYLLFALLA
jgi:para-aminobenzoate synthetase